MHDLICLSVFIDDQQFVLQYLLPFPVGGWTGATEVREVVHTHSLSQPGPF